MLVNYNDIILYHTRGDFMSNYYTPFSLRVSEQLISKLKVISTQHKRSTNKEIEFALEKYVNEYEMKNGSITVED